MSIQSIQNSPIPLELRHANGAASVRPAGPTAGPVGVVAPSTAADPAPTGDGPVLTSLKQSLAAAGFSQSNAVDGQGDDKAAMHGFTHAFFDSVQARRQSDEAAGRPTTMRGAIRQLSAEAAAGNAPADLQSAFTALQQTQTPGSAASTATLSSVLSGMAKTAPDDVSTIGSLVDASA